MTEPDDADERSAIIESLMFGVVVITGIGLWLGVRWLVDLLCGAWG